MSMPPINQVQGDGKTPCATVHVTLQAQEDQTLQKTNSHVVLFSPLVDIN